MCESNQNPGDLRILDGKELEPFPKILINGSEYEDPNQFDEILLLPGSNFSEEEELAALKETGA